MGMESPETAHKADDSYRGSTAVGCVQTRRIGGFSFARGLISFGWVRTKSLFGGY